MDWSIDLELWPYVVTKTTSQQLYSKKHHLKNDPLDFSMVVGGIGEMEWGFLNQ